VLKGTVLKRASHCRGGILCVNKMMVFVHRGRSTSETQLFALSTYGAQMHVPDEMARRDDSQIRIQNIDKSR